MSQKRNFKFYTHHSRFIGQNDKNGGPKRHSVSLEQKLLRGISLAFEICFHFGNTLLLLAKKAAKQTANELEATAAYARRRKFILKQSALPKTLAIFCLIAILSYGTFLAFGFLAKGLELKNQLLSTGRFGQSYLLAAKDALQNQDLSLAQNKFSLAFQSFVKGREQLNQEGALVNQLLNVLPIKRDSDKALQVAELLSSAGLDITEIYSQTENLHLSAAGVADQSGQSFKPDDIYGSLEKIMAKIDAAENLFSQIDGQSLPPDFREKFVLAKNNLTILQNAFAGLKDTAFLAQNLFGGKKHLLILMENNNELRPSGGFMGTYGDLKLDNGKILAVNISSIYDLDGQLQTKIRPPFPILAVNDSWFLRDSNWFADFPQTAKKISDFYEKEGGETPDAIIVLTPNLISELLTLTGPIQMPNYGLTITQDNFVETIQVASSVTYSKVDNKPKQILADILPIILGKLQQLDRGQLPQFFEIIQQNLTQKQIAVYSRDNATENLISSFNWGGQVLPSDRDYLSVVDANLSGTKTDLFMSQSISLKSSIGDDGSITDELTLTKTNKMPRLDNSSNTGYIRIFVPQGAKLLSNTGFDYRDVPIPPSDGYKIDPDVEAWEQTITRDLVSGTSVGQEAGKTFFGNWLTLLGGETKTVKLTYTLPFKVADIDHYSLLVQKQLGALPSDFSYSLNFPGWQILWSNFNPNSLQANALSTNFSLDKDYLLGAVLGKR
jgi:hypothetical protein